MPLKKCLASHQTEEGIPEKQKRLCHGKDSRKTCHICIKWLITEVAAGGHAMCGGKERVAEKAKLAQRQEGCKVEAGDGRQVF